MRSGTSAVASGKRISRKQKFGILAAAIAGVFAFRGARAVDYTWDATGTNGVPPAGGTGVWDAIGLKWTADNGTNYVAWPNTDPNFDTAAFGGTAGTVSLGTAIFSGGVIFNTTGYILDNGGNAANTLNTGSVTVTNALDSATISAIITGSGGLSKDGAGTLTLTGANTYTGNTTVFDGTLALGAGGTINAAGDLGVFFGVVNVGAEAATANVVQVGAGASITGTTGSLTATGSFQMNDGSVSANLAGAVALVKTTAGTMVLSGTNTYTGGTQISGGVLSISADANLGANTGALSIGGGTLRSTADLTLDAGRAITMAAGGGTFDVASGTTTTFGGVIDGTNTLTKMGAGTLALNGANTYNGATTIVAGTLSLGGGGSLNTASTIFVSGGTLDVGATNQTVGAVSLFSGSLAGTGGSLSATSVTANAGSISAILAGPGGLTKNSVSGTVTLTAANTYSGTTLVNQGTLALGTGGSISGSSNLTVAGGTFALGANSTAANVVTLTAGSITGAGGGVLTGSSYSVQAGTISAILGGATSSLTKSGTGLVTLSAANTYGGSTLVNAGTLAIGAGGSIANTSDLTVNGGTFDIGAISTSVGPVVLSNGNINGTTGVLSSPSYLMQNGTVSASLGNAGAALTKNTGGTVTLKGSNSYGGGTTVSAGTLAMTNNNALGSGGITLDGGTLQLGETPTVPGLVGQYWVGGQGGVPNPTNITNINPDFASTAAFNAKYNPLTVTVNNVATTTGGVTQLDWPDTGGNPFGNQGVAFGDNISARWTGKILIPTGGSHTFFTRSDDGSMIFIDGVQVVNNNLYQGQTERSNTIDLAAGYHDFTMLFYEGGGNAGVTASWIPVGGGKQTIPNSVLFQTPAGAAATFGSALPVNVTASSGLDLSLSAPGSTHNLGALTRAGTNTLTINGQGRTLNFTGTSLAGSPGDNIGFDTTATLNPGLISDGAATGLILTKSGTGALILNNGSNDLNGTSIDLKAGTLRVLASGAGVDPLGGASVVLDGGTLSLSNPAGGTDFNPALSIADSSTIERVGNTSDTLSSALAIPAGKNLSLSVLGGSLSRSVAISGDGGLIKLGRGTLSFDGTAANTYTGGTTVGTGVLQLNKPAGVNAVSDLTVNYGRVGWSADEQIADTATVNLNGGGVLDLNGKTETIAILNTTGGSTSGSTLIVPTINKSLGNTTTIGSRLVIPGGNINVTGGTLRLTNTATGAGANDLTGVTLNISNGGNLRVERTVGGSNPIGSNAIPLNNGSITIGGQTSYEQGGLAGQIFKPLPFNLQADNQIANTGDANLSLRGMLAYDSLANLNKAFDSLMAVPYGGVALSSQFNFIGGINTMGTVGVGGLGSLMANTPTPVNTLNFGSSQATAGPNNFGIKWSGKINITSPGLTSFFTNSDDGTVVFVDGVPVVYNNFFQGDVERNGSINLTAGLHDIVIGYVQGGGGADASVSWTPAGGTKQLLTGSVLLSPTITDTAPITTTGVSTINVTDSGIANVGPLTVNGQLNVVGGAVVPSSTTFDGNVTILTTGAGLITNNVAETNGPVTLTKTGSGALTLKGNSGLTGGINVNQGVLIIDGTSNHSAMNVNAFGILRQINQASVGNVDINVNNGGVMDVAVANADLSRVKVKAGGKLSLGAAQNPGAGAVIPTTPISGIFEVRGFDIGNAYPLTINAGGGVNIYNNGGNRIYASALDLQGTGQVTFTSTGNVTTFNGLMSGSAGFTLNSNTEVRLEGSHQYTGPTIVEQGILKSREGGNLQNTSSILTINGEIWADDGGNNFSVDRFFDGGTINMRGGALRHFGKNGATSSETFGTVNALGGVTIDSQATAAATIGIMTINNLVRPVGGRVNFPNTNNLGSSTATQTGRIFINNFQNGAGALAPFSSANLNDGLIGGGVTVGTDFATYTDAFGVTPLTTFNTVADTTTPWVATDNVKLTLSANPAVAALINANRTINSLTVVAQNVAQTLDLRTFNLVLDTGGLSQSGGQTLNIGATTPTTGTITANGGELFALAANTIQFNNPIVNNGATPLALTIGGGGTIRLASLSNGFTGGIYISSSTLNTASITNVGKTIGSNVINFSGNGTLALKDNGTASNVTLSYGNNVNVFGNATIDVNNSSANTGSLFVMGDLLMDPGRTLSVTGANGYRLQMGNVTLNGNAIFNPTTAELTVGSLNDQGTARILTKTGGQAMNLSAAATSWTGTAVINGGALNVNAAGALGAAAPSVIVNYSGVFGAGVINQDLSNVVFNNGGGLRVIAAMDSNVPGTLPTSPITVLELGTTNFPAGYNNVPLNPAGALFRQAQGAAGTYASNLTLPGPVQFDIPSQNTTISGQIAGTGSIQKIGGNVLILAPASPNTYTGGTWVQAGTLNANSPGALGTGPVNAISGSLGYNANGAASGQVVYASGASIQQLVGQINIGTGVTGFGNDRFDIAAGNVISADQARLKLLSRYGSSTMASNINLAPGAIVAHQDVGGVNDIQDLGTTPDLFFGIGTTGNTANWAGSNINIGANTPWMGVSTDRGSRRIFSGDIVIDDGSNGGTQPATLTSVTLQGVNLATLTLGNDAAAPTMGIRKSNPANGKVDVNLVGRVTLQSNQANFDGVNKFILQYGSFLSFAQGTAMGSGAGITAIEALSGSVMDIGGGTPTTGGAVNGTITMRAGSVFRVDDAAQFTGIGNIFVDPGSIVPLRNSGVFSNLPNPQVTGAVPGAGFTNAKGAIFRLEADNITNLDAATSDQSIFSIAGANRTTGTLTINTDTGQPYLNGGVTIYDNNSRSLTFNTPNTLNIGSGGMFFSSDASANGTFTLTVNGSGAINVAAGANLTIGSPRIEFQDKNGHVQIDLPFNNAINSITKITSGDFVLNNASTAVVGTLVTGDIVGGGGGGAIRLGNANSNLSARSLAGTVAGNIILGDRVRADVYLDLTPAGRAQVLQKFTVDGAINNDGRKFLVQRTAGGNTGVDMQNVVLKSGMISLDENNTDVRMNLTMAGDGIVGQAATNSDPFDFINIVSDVPGTARVLTQGRLADLAGVSAVFGTVSGDITINQVRGGLRFDPATGAGQLQPGAIINSLGVQGSIEVRTGQNGTSPLNGGTINLGGGAALNVFVDSSDGAPITNNPNVAVNIAAGQLGNIGSNRNATGANPGTSLITSVNMGADSTLSLTAQNTARTRIGTVNMAGNGTINNVSSDTDISVGTVAAGANIVNFDGTRSTQVTGNVTGSALAANGFVTFNPGASNTSNVNVSSATVRGAIGASSGITNFGSTVINGTAASNVAGLLEQFQSGTGSGLYEGTLPATNVHGVPLSVQLYPRRANQARGNTDANFNPATGWVDNSTYIYSGQVLVPDNGTPSDGQGSIAFGASFDDAVLVKVDGVQVMRDTNWQNSTSSGELALSAGWHDIEIRFGEGGGGVGPDNDINVTGWGATFPDASGFAAIGIQTDPSLGFDANSGTNGATGNFATVAKYHNPVDNGTMNLFRVSTPASGDVNVGAGAELRAGGLSGIVNANLNGAAGSTALLTLVDTGTPISSTVTNLVANGDGAISASANSPIAAANLVVGAGANLSLSGGGTLTVNTSHTLGDGSIVKIDFFKLVVNSTANAGNGGIDVNNGGKLGGSGNILGTVTVNNGGHVAPGNSVGTISVGGLTLNGGGLLDVEGDAGGFDRINVTVDNAFSIAGPTTIGLTDLGGATAGDYVLIDYGIAFTGNFSDLSLASGTLGTFSASLVNDSGDTSIKLHLEPAGLQAQWNVDADGSWGVAANWDPQTVPNASSAIANFLGKITADRTVTLDGARTVATVNFNNASTYTIAPGSGGSLTVMNGINVDGGSHVISAPLAIGGNATVNGVGTLTSSGGLLIGAGKTLTKNGAGTLTISGAQGHGVGAALVVNRGVVNLDSNAGGGTAASSNLSLSISGGAGGTSTVNLGANQDLASLTINTGDASSQTLDLASPAGAGQFRQIQVFAADLSTAKIALYNAIVNANAAGAVDPLDGITDSGLHAGAKIGLALLGDHVTIRPTQVGDLNLDGAVTISDFIDLASNFNTVGTATWQEGDLNYDKSVSISDFIDLASNFNATYSGGAAAISAEDRQVLASFASSIGADPSVVGSAVPEPGTMSLLAIGAMGLMGRRRRNRKA